MKQVTDNFNICFYRNTGQTLKINARLFLLQTEVVLKMAVFWVVAPCSLVEVLLKMAVFWVVPPCSLVQVYHRFTRLHGATTQKTPIFILAAVRTSNPT
jgi:hypothetical protein